MLEVARPQVVEFAQRWKAPLNTYTLGLFKNNWIPSPDDDMGDYSLCDFTGYAPIALTLWGDAYLDSDLFATIEETNRTFNCTGVTVTNNVYGYVVYIGGTLLWAERSASAPFAMDAAGKTYTVKPKLVLRNLSEA